MINSAWNRRTLAHNLKWYRAVSGLSQSAFAKKAKLSYRVIQDIESGKSNPTIETLGSVARCLKMTIKRLLELSVARPKQGVESFVETYKKEFADAPIAAGLRDLDGTAIWANSAMERLYGNAKFDSGPVSLFEYVSTETKGILKSEMQAQKLGSSYSYTLSHTRPATGELVYWRCHPTLIYANDTLSPKLVSVYIAEVSSDTEENYYEYCKGLLRSLYP